MTWVMSDEIHKCFAEAAAGALDGIPLSEFRDRPLFVHVGA